MNKALRSIDSPRYRYRQAIYRSFYSAKLYADVVKRWKGRGFLYLLFVIAIISIPLSLLAMSALYHYAEDELISPIENIPTLYIQDGKISFDKPMPYLVKNKQNEVVAIIDTTGKVTEITKQYPKLSILFTKNKMTFKVPEPPELFFIKPAPKSKVNIVERDIPAGDNEVFIAKEWLKDSGIKIGVGFFLLLCFPAIVVGLCSIYFILLLTLSMLGQVVSLAFFHYKLKYSQACRLYAVASTPQIFLFSLSLIFKINFPGLGVLQLSLLAMYFCFGVLATKYDSKAMVKH